MMKIQNNMVQINGSSFESTYERIFIFAYLQYNHFESKHRFVRLKLDSNYLITLHNSWHMLFWFMESLLEQYSHVEMREAFFPNLS